ncbi:hypothetical protein FB567DRAFT_564505 [Paraphoma chrysanthemicola]|uniref:Uncharacterized protein n=1 Tax=Paraphoma chrysanthemicola TaxID=798071 RepID=A0A8K0VTG8_9PLEO|nr:hypothetical protein FB567DRAFT_564505 [Paraphoma chrysanthemicola]
MQPGQWFDRAKRLFAAGKWKYWLLTLAGILYTAVSVGCLNKQKLLMRSLYLASYSPSAGTQVRIGYFGVCVQTPQMPNDWICSRFRRDKTIGLEGEVLRLVRAIKALQSNALYPLPAIAAGLLFILLPAFLLLRSRSKRAKRGFIWAWWFSCAVALAAGLLPMMVSQAMHYVGPVYQKDTLVQFNVMGMVLTWIAVAAHLGFVGAVVWYDKMGAGGEEYEMEMAETGQYPGR